MTREAQSDWVRLVAVSKLQKRIGNSVCIGGRDYAVFVDGDHSFVFDNDCPHQGGPLSEGRCEGGTVICPWHGWEFDLEDGRFIVNDAIRIGVYPSKIEDAHVWARLPQSS